MNAASSSKLSYAPYRRAITQLSEQFELLRYALRSIKEPDRKRFSKEIKSRDLKALELFKKNSQLLPPGVLTPEIEELCTKSLSSKALKAQRSRNKITLHQYLEFPEVRLDQSELLLRIAYFEAFMRIVHEAFLRAAPGKVFGVSFRGKQGIKVALSDVFNKGNTHWLSPNLLTELIQKEVKWLDAQNIEQRASYFEKHFAITFGKKDEIKKLTKIMRRRNEIAHEVFEWPMSQDERLQGKEPPLPTAEMLQLARKLFSEIPEHCVKQGATIYQSYFSRF